MWNIIYKTGTLTLIMCLIVMGEPLKDLNLMGFLSMSGKVWPGGPALYPGIQMALRQINERDDILPGYRLNLIWRDSKCDAGTGTNVMYEMLHEAPVKHMIAGPVCSLVAEVQAQAAHFWNISHFAFASTSPVLSDKTRFPRFFRVIPPDTRYNLARLALLDYFNWKKVATINVARDFFSAITDDLVTRLQGTDINIITQEIFDEDPTSRVNNLKKKDARIILAACYEVSARLILCAAYHAGLFGHKIVWMFPGWYVDYWWRINLEDVPCTAEEMDIAAEGHFLTAIYFVNPKDQIGVGNWNPTQFYALMKQEPTYEPEAHLFEYMAAPAYDTIWGCALALNCTINTMNEQGYNKTLDQFTYSDGDIGDIMTSCIYNVSFMGLTGAVKFDRTGDPLKNIKLVQIQDLNKVTVGTYILEEDEWYLEWYGDGIRWAGDEPPRDSTEVTMLENSIPVTLYISMSTLATLGNIIAIVLLCFNITYRNHVYVKLSSPTINNVLIFGCIFSYSSVYLFAFNDTNATLCKLRHFTFTVGFTSAFGAMFSKTWRVYKIFCNKKLLRVKINDFHLIAMVIVMTSVMLLILLVWEFVDPLFIQTLVLENESYPIGNDALAIPFIKECNSTHYYYFLWSMCIVEGVLLAFGAFLSFETRKVRIAALNDSWHIGLCLYNVIILSGLVLILSILLEHQITLVYGIFSGFVILGTSTTLAIVFVPKIQSVFYPHTVEPISDTLNGTRIGTTHGVQGLNKTLEHRTVSSTIQSRSIEE